MNLKINSDTLTEKMEAFSSMLKGLRKNNLKVAIIGRDSENWPPAVLAAAYYGAEIKFLDENLEPHVYRQILSEGKYECMLYSSEFKELAYSIYNSGSTVIQDFICIDDMDMDLA